MLQKITSFLFNHQPFGIFLIRITLGIMMVYHGFPKILSFFDFLENIQKMGFMYPKILGTLAIASEFIGGIFLILGFFSRTSAFFVSAVMGTTAFFVHLHDPFAKKEMALVYLAMSLCILFCGGGVLSLRKSS